MPKLPYVPAQDCRHRTAAIALYRALVLAARQFSVPNDVFRLPSDVHPVVHLVQQRFKGNKDDRSPRLVYSSMTAGYKFLDMLHKAKNESSLERKKIVRLLRNQSAERQAAEARRAKSVSSTEDAREHDWREKEAEDHTIRNVAGPFELPRYKGDARPLSSLKRRREVPYLVVESMGFPFLRYKGATQSKGLNQMILSHKRRYMHALYSMIPLEEEVAPDVQLEDDWEENVEKALCEEEGVSPPRWAEMDEDPQSSYTWAVTVAKLWYELKLERLRHDFVERGKALADIVEDEKRLQALEDEQGIWGTADAHSSSPDMKSMEDAMRTSLKASPLQDSGQSQHPNAKADYAQKVTAHKASEPMVHPPPSTRDKISTRSLFDTQINLRRWHDATEMYEQENNGQLPEVDAKDPFVNPLWGKFVDLSDRRIRKRMASVPNAGANRRFHQQKGKTGGRGEDDEDGEFAAAFMPKNRENQADLEW